MQNLICAPPHFPHTPTISHPTSQSMIDSNHPTSIGTIYTLPPRMCFIDKLPNEILHRIFSFIEFGNLIQRKSKGRENTYQGAVLRAVSHQFRTVANESSWWFQGADLVFYDDALLAKRRVWDIQTKSQLYNDLASDSRLCERLGRRTIWRFADVKSVVAVLKHVPSIFSNVRGVELSGGIHACMDCLSACANLTHLVLLSYHNLLDLSMISKCLPHLTHLSLSAYKTVASVQLSNLTEFTIVMRPVEDILTPHNLPWASARTLRVIKMEAGRFEEWYGLASDHHAPRFPSLETVILNQLQHEPNGLHGTLHFWSSLPLKTVRLGLPIRMYPSLFFWFPGFRTLQSLRLETYGCNLNSPHEGQLQSFNLAVTGIILSFPKQLRELVLVGPLDLSWAMSLGSLTKLESLYWSTLSSFYIHTTCRDMHGYETFKHKPVLLF
jgi:hypothetical protein